MKRNKISRLNFVVLILAVLLSCVLPMSISMAKTGNASLDSGEGSEGDMADYSLSEIKEMNALDEGFELTIGEEGYLEELYGTYSDIKIDSWEDALYSLYNIKTLLGMDCPSEELEFQERYQSHLAGGGYSYEFRQVNKGQPVSDRGIVISCDEQGNIDMLSSSYLNMETIQSIEQRELRKKYLGMFVNILLLVVVVVWLVVTILAYWKIIRKYRKLSMLQ